LGAEVGEMVPKRWSDKKDTIEQMHDRKIRYDLKPFTM
jgi:hypothetical protein